MEIVNNFFLTILIFLLLTSSLYILLTANSLLAIFALLCSAITLALILLLISGANFIPIILIIVYCGAIIILFIFLVTIVNQVSPEKLKTTLSKYTWKNFTLLIGSTIGLIISIGIKFILNFII